MTFIDFEFGLFLLLGVLLFYVCPVKHRWKILLLISVIFYAIASVKYLPFIFVTSLTVWLGGRKMGERWQQLDQRIAEKDVDRKEKKVLKESAKKDCKKVMSSHLATECSKVK